MGEKIEKPDRGLALLIAGVVGDLRGYMRLMTELSEPFPLYLSLVVLKR